MCWFWWHTLWFDRFKAWISVSATILATSTSHAWGTGKKNSHLCKSCPTPYRNSVSEATKATIALGSSVNLLKRESPFLPLSTAPDLWRGEPGLPVVGQEAVRRGSKGMPLPSVPPSSASTDSHGHRVPGTKPSVIPRGILVGPGWGVQAVVIPKRGSWRVMLQRCSLQAIGL